MLKYFCVGRFIEIRKEKYAKVSILRICFDPQKPVEKTKYNKPQLHPLCIVIEIENKKCIIDYVKLIEHCHTGSDIDDDNSEIVITINIIILGTNKLTISALVPAKGFNCVSPSII
ncbi:MAG: hypothetical protein Ta2E_00330 [Mycoplasmoidaceae bacterium]|nr:MAG: hypothetical protein Ta2E_00330 [Mycoplasmoidaceae bacterium]